MWQGLPSSAVDAVQGAGTVGGCVLSLGDQARPQSLALCSTPSSHRGRPHEPGAGAEGSAGDLQGNLVLAVGGRRSPGGGVSWSGRGGLATHYAWYGDPETPASSGHQASRAGGARHH